MFLFHFLSRIHLWEGWKAQWLSDITVNPNFWCQRFLETEWADCKRARSKPPSKNLKCFSLMSLKQISRQVQCSSHLFWQGKTYTQNAASLLKFWHNFQCRKFGVCNSKGCKVTGHQTLRMIPPQAILNPGQLVWVGPGLWMADVFSKPPTLTANNFAAYIYSIERSKPF